MLEQKHIGKATTTGEDDDLANGYHARASSSTQMTQPPSPVLILHELDLGQHILFIMDDGSIDICANDQETPYLADNGLSLNSDETYRLFICLQEQFKQKEVIQPANPLME